MYWESQSMLDSSGAGQEPAFFILGSGDVQCRPNRVSSFEGRGMRLSAGSRVGILRSGSQVRRGSSGKGDSVLRSQQVPQKCEVGSVPESRESDRVRAAQERLIHPAAQSVLQISSRNRRPRAPQSFVSRNLICTMRFSFATSSWRLPPSVVGYLAPSLM